MAISKMKFSDDFFKNINWDSKPGFICQIWSNSSTNTENMGTHKFNRSLLWLHIFFS